MTINHTIQILLHFVTSINEKAVTETHMKLKSIELCSIFWTWAHLLHKVSLRRTSCHAIYTSTHHTC